MITMDTLTRIPLRTVNKEGKQCKMNIIKTCREKLGRGIVVKIISEDLLVSDNGLTLQIKYKIFIDGDDDNSAKTRVLNHELKRIGVKGKEKRQ